MNYIYFICLNPHFLWCFIYLLKLVNNMVKSFAILTFVFALFSLANASDAQNQFEGFGVGADNFTCQVDNCLACQQGQENICADCDGELVFIDLNCACVEGLFQINVVDCVGCINSCDECSDAETCDTCFQGYYYDSGAKTCSLCSSNCLSCNSASVCDQCESGYVDNGGVCQALPDSVDGVIIDGDEVIECPPGCGDCDNSESCNTCNDGYYKNAQTTCSVCDVTCSTCDGGTENDCQSCPSSFLLQSGACVTCRDDRCIDCPSVSTTCTLCTLGYGVSNGDCALCEKNCIQCSKVTNCLTCSAGYILFSGDCVECLSGCGVCNINNYVECLECIDGYYMQGEGECILCPTGCSTCDSATTCQTCSDGYQLSDNFCYEACIHPCYTCVNGQPTSCTLCFSGYIKNGSKCDEDTSCNGTSTCSACPRAYYLTDAGKCLDCQTTSQSCIKCQESDPTACTQCSTGYYLTTDCNACPSECSACESLYICSSCAVGYYLIELSGVSTGQCGTCSADYFCSECVGSEYQCTNCLQGYSLDSTKCISDQNVEVSMILDISIEQFLALMNSFKIAITDSMGPPYKGNPHYITFTGIFEGSVFLNTTITVPTNASVDDAASTLTSNLVENATFGNVTLISAPTIQVVEAKEPVDPTVDPEEPEETTNEVNLGLVLGLSIPLLLILLSLILIIKSKSGRDMDLQDEVIESNEQFSSKV